MNVYFVNQKISNLVFNAATDYVGQDPTFEKIPVGYINKGKCGCGITSFALESQQSCIIAEPNVSLCKNKGMQYWSNVSSSVFKDKTAGKFRGKYEILCVYQGVSERDVRYYAERMKKYNAPIKIMVTYDSISKCKNYLDDCQLIIDECDKVLGYQPLKSRSKKEAYDNDAITKLLELAEQHQDNVSFISATPINVKYMPEFVKSLPQVNFLWGGYAPFTPILMERRFPFKSLQEEIITPIINNGSVTIGGHTFSRVIFFINSVDYILKCIRETGMNKNDAAIMFGDSVSNAIKKVGYNELKSCRNLPKFTFITSCGFSGIDLYDDDAMTVVVSSTDRNYHMIDLDTDLLQAVGRQRNKNNPHYGSYIFMYDTNYFTQSEAELQQCLDEDKRTITDNCDILNEYIDRASKGGDDGETAARQYESLLKILGKNHDFLRFSMKSGGRYEFCENLYQSLVYKLNNVRKMYTNGLTSGVDKHFQVTPIVIPAPKLSYKGFTSLKKKFNRLKNAGKNIFSNLIDAEFTQEERNTDDFKIIKKYIDVKKGLPTNSTYAKSVVSHLLNNELQFKADLFSQFYEGQFCTSSTLKQLISNVYRQYGIGKKPIPADLEDFGIKLKQEMRYNCYTQNKDRGYKIVKIPSLDAC